MIMDMLMPEQFATCTECAIATDAFGIFRTEVYLQVIIQIVFRPKRFYTELQ